MICKKCGAELPEGVLFCPACGSKVEKTVPADNAPADTLKCVGCGAQLKPGAKFCPVCGAKTGEPAPAATQNTATAPAPAPTPAASNNCPVCGFVLKPGAKFCPSCGKNMNEPAAAPAPDPAPAPAPSNNCPVCGFALKPGAKFCPSCGKNMNESPTAPIPVPPAANITAPAPAASGSYAPMPGSVAAPVKKPIKPGIIIGICGGVAALIAIIVVIVILVNQPVKINLNNYVSVTFDGYDGSGEAHLSIDTDKLNQDYKGKLSYTSEIRNFSYYFDPDDPTSVIAEFAEDNGYLDPEYRLKNGDKVKLSWTIEDKDIEELNKYIHCSLEFSDQEFTAEGLKPLDDYDPFAKVKLKCYGTSPEGTAYVTDESGDYRFTFKLSKEEGLSNGEKVKVTVVSPSDSYTLEEYAAEYYHCKVTATEKEFTVEGLNYVASKLSEIPNEATNKMKEATENYIKNHNYQSNKKIISTDYLGTVVLAPKTPSSDRETYYYPIYKVKMAITDSTTKKTSNVEYYTYCRFDSITIRGEDGSYSPTYFYGEPTQHYIYSADGSSEFDGYESYQQLYDDNFKYAGTIYNVDSNVPSES